MKVYVYVSNAMIDHDVPDFFFLNLVFVLPSRSKQVNLWLNGIFAGK